MFKENFEKICAEKNLYPTAVCQAIGLAKATYSCWTETSVPRKTTLLKLADYLGVSVEYLKGETDEENAEQKNNSPYGELSEAQQSLIKLIPTMSEKQVEKVHQIISLLESEE